MGDAPIRRPAKGPRQPLAGSAASRSGSGSAVEANSGTISRSFERRSGSLAPSEENSFSLKWYTAKEKDRYASCRPE